MRLEVYSWWNQSSERDAFNEVIRLHESKHPDVDVDNLYDPDAPQVREHMTKRLLAGAPPATFQANIGADLLRWTVVDTQGDAVKSSSRIGGLATLFDRTGLTENLAPELREALEKGGVSQVYAVPINIHRLNVLYYNTQALERFQAAHPGKSLLDLGTLCPADPSTEAPLDVGIAVGAAEGFTLVLLAFENVLPALTNGTFYDELFRGGAPRAVSGSGDFNDEVRRALECVQYLSRSFITESPGLGWADAVDKVRTGEATFTVMGDWANGELMKALDEGAVEAVPFPGSEGTFVFTSDTFPLPGGAEHEPEVEELLETIASSRAQVLFSQRKGSIPARFDVDWSALGARRAATHEDFVHARRVLATSGLFPPYYPQEELGKRLGAMIAPGAGAEELEDVLTLFRDAEPLLGMWQARLAATADEQP